MRICDYCKNPIPGVNSGGLTLLVNDAEAGTILQHRMDLCRNCQKVFMGKLIWAIRENTAVPTEKGPRRYTGSPPVPGGGTLSQSPGERVGMMV